MQRYDMAAGTSPLRKSDALTSLLRERVQHCSVSPQPSSWRGKQRKSDPKDRRTLWRCKERSVNSENLISPCASRLQTVVVVVLN